MTETREQPAHYNQEDAEETLRFTIRSAIISLTHRTRIIDGDVVRELTESIYQAILNDSTCWAVKFLTTNQESE
jgi:hypothetical protein